jgi:hypothetical protein
MSFEQLISKKLGVVSAALFILYKLAADPWLVVIVVLVYMAIQGILDCKKGGWR